MKPNIAPIVGSTAGKKSLFRNRAETVPKMKKSYHSIVDPMNVDAMMRRFCRVVADAGLAIVCLRDFDIRSRGRGGFASLDQVNQI
ncbi:hypothetical protein ACFFYR_05340 [Paraburkholderia dipogonis]|uniref:hypothetical protein n=1 Tax=Paraburkholderia dipogonis TaxID=1211383 RepID=UPI001FCA52FE|nr:hypothetical protein [Paraburkholderia dipogonis]